MIRLGAIAGVVALAASAQALQPPLHIQRLLEKVLLMMLPKPIGRVS